MNGQEAPAPTRPAWSDANSGYLTIPLDESAKNAAAIVTANQIATTRLQDAHLEPVSHTNPIDTSPLQHRHLAPPSTSTSVSQPGDNKSSASPIGGRLPVQFRLPFNSAYTVASALSIVVGLFLLFVWLIRRGARGVAKTLPADVVSVLGRVPFATKQYADLLRVGNKLVLVAQTPSGPTTLTEVSDAMEVDRLVGLCQQADPHSTTKAFEQVFRKLTQEAAPGGFLGHEASLAPVSPSTDPLRQLRTEARRV